MKVAFLIALATLAIHSTVRAQDLRCLDLVGCKSNAGCGGPGSPSGCLILCEDGAVVSCP